MANVPAPDPGVRAQFQGNVTADEWNGFRLPGSEDLRLPRGTRVLSSATAASNKPATPNLVNQRYRNVVLRPLDESLFGRARSPEKRQETYISLVECHNGLLDARKGKWLSNESIYRLALRLTAWVQDDVSAGTGFGPFQDDQTRWWITPSTSFLSASGHAGATTRSRLRGTTGFRNAAVTIHFVCSVTDETDNMRLPQDRGHISLLIYNRQTRAAWYLDSYSPDRDTRGRDAWRAFQQWLRSSGQPLPPANTNINIVPVPEQLQARECSFHAITNCVSFVRFGLFGWHMVDNLVNMGTPHNHTMHNLLRSLHGIMRMDLVEHQLDRQCDIANNLAMQAAARARWRLPGQAVIPPPPAPLAPPAQTRVPLPTQRPTKQPAKQPVQQPATQPTRQPAKQPAPPQPPQPPKVAPQRLHPPRPNYQALIAQTLPGLGARTRPPNEHVRPAVNSDNFPRPRRRARSPTAVLPLAFTRGDDEDRDDDEVGRGDRGRGREDYGGGDSSGSDGDDSIRWGASSSSSSSSSSDEDDSSEDDRIPGGGYYGSDGSDSEFDSSDEDEDGDDSRHGAVTPIERIPTPTPHEILQDWQTRGPPSPPPFPDPQGAPTYTVASGGEEQAGVSIETGVEDDEPDTGEENTDREGSGELSPETTEVARFLDEQTLSERMRQVQTRLPEPSNNTGAPRDMFDMVIDRRRARGTRAAVKTAARTRDEETRALDEEIARIFAGEARHIDPEARARRLRRLQAKAVGRAGREFEVYQDSPAPARSVKRTQRRWRLGEPAVLFVPPNVNGPPQGDPARPRPQLPRTSVGIDHDLAESSSTDESIVNTNVGIDMVAGEDSPTVERQRAREARRARIEGATTIVESPFGQVSRPPDFLESAAGEISIPFHPA